MRRIVIAVAAAIAAIAACGEPSLQPGSVCTPGEFRCEENAYEVCADDGDSFELVEDCTAADQVCLVGPGCLTCVPNSRTCDGFDVVRCREDGSGSDVIATCDGDIGDVCFGGRCVNACELAEENRSYEGCEYWPVDLDNAVVADQGAAAAQQFSVVLSNASQLVARVVVEIYCTAEDAENPALQCEEGQSFVLDDFDLGPGGLEIVDLDPRELDGSSSPELNDGPGTWRSMHAYRISSSAPLVAYQFNPLENVNVFSNDASLLLPTAALADRYYVLSWPQTLALTNDGMTNGTIDLRAFLTIVGVQDDTEVNVRLSTDTLGGADLLPGIAGETITFSLDRYEVVNLETDGFNADFTSSQVFTTGGEPIAVFTGSEASDVPRFDSFLERACCADHMEQQLFPEVAFGTRFVAVKTPLRSTYVEKAGWNVALVPDEPEWWRILATGEDTVVTTNLPPPNDAWLLQRGQSVIFESERDFVVSSNEPIAFAQFPGGQATTGIPSTLPGGERPPGGDPSFILIPPVQQWRERYLFLVPNKYAFDFLLIAAPAAAEVRYDGAPLDLILACETEPIGFLPTGPEGADVEYLAYRCPLSAPEPGGEGLQDDGVHEVVSATGEPIGLVVWGFDSYVSYGYPGGTNVDLINPE